MKTFVRVSEVWVPTRDGAALELGKGSYGALAAFGELSRTIRFEHGEGLPGRAWAARKPVVLRSFEEGSCFLRTDAAKAAGLATALAMPVFAGDVLTAVVVFFGGDDRELVGAIELWDDVRGSGELQLVEGFYGAASSFEWISRSASFRPGHGLPGMVWASGMPQILPDLGRTSHFLRADPALRAGIEQGLGVPCGGRAGRSSVVTFLSGYDTPIAHRFEVWVPDAAGERLTLHEGVCGTDADLPTSLADVSIRIGEGSIGRSMRTGIPVLVDDLAREEGEAMRRAAAKGLGSMLVLPVLEDGTLCAIVTMYFALRATGEA